MPPGVPRALVAELSDPERIVLVSGFGDDGRGGMFALRNDGVEILDSVATVGVAYADGRFGRLLRAPVEVSSTTELVVYDERGVLEYRRLDAVRDPHDLLAHDGGWLVVSSGTNEIVHVGPNELRVVWHRDGEPDAWHVNCLVSEGDDIWLSAFGEFTIFKEWRDRAAVGRGMITNLRTGESIGGLTHPHSPRLVDGSWLICESLDGLLVRRDRSGAKVAEQDLGGYTRGLAVTATFVLAGVSAPRADKEASAHIALLDRDTLAVLARMPVPCREIYDIVVVPTGVIDAVRAGFGTNGFRVRQQGLAALDALGSVPTAELHVGEPFDYTGACQVSCDLPATLDSDTRWNAAVEIENTGTSWLASLEPRPVYVASRWTDEQGTQFDGVRMPLPVTLPPGHRTIVALPMAAPPPGVYRLTVSLVREGEYWFDDVDRGYGAAQRVSVTPGPAH